MLSNVSLRVANTVSPRYKDTIVPKDVAIKMNLLLLRILNELNDM